MKKVQKVQAYLIDGTINCKMLLTEDSNSVQFTHYLFRSVAKVYISWRSPSLSLGFGAEDARGNFQFTGSAWTEQEPDVCEQSNAALLGASESVCDCFLSVSGKSNVLQPEILNEATGSEKTKDYFRWRCRVHKKESLIEFLRREVVEEGMVRINCGTTTLDILIQGLSSQRLGGQSVCLVSFEGAMLNRAGTRPPYISGRGVAEKLQLPLIGIADPTLDLDESLTLGWYAGNADCRNLSKNIAEILDHLAQLLDLHYVIFGGSGGGFASLVQASLLTCDSTTVVWNPQTSIGRYGPKFVLRYIASAFPELSAEAAAALALPSRLRLQSIERLLDRTGILHSVLDAPPGKRAKVLYLQNREDWHVHAHAKPYLKQVGWRRLGTNSFAQGENLALHLGDWGGGHTPVPTELLIRAVGEIAQGRSVAKIATSLAEATPEDQYCQWFAADLTSATARPIASCNRDNSGLRLEIGMPALPSVENLEYALCMLRNGDRVKFFDFQSSPVFSIDLNDNEVDEIEVLVRDYWQEVRACNYAWPL